jgi:hypothetical protein
MDKYKKFKKNFLANLDKDVIYCPNPKCEQFVNTKVQDACTDCQTRVCKKCQTIEHLGSKCQVAND